MIYLMGIVEEMTKFSACTVLGPSKHYVEEILAPVHSACTAKTVL